jgi:hypothetical protein
LKTKTKKLTAAQRDAWVKALAALFATVAKPAAK